MSTETTSAAAASTQSNTGVVKSRSKSVQSQRAANAITEAGQTIDKALADPAIIALLSPRGYDAVELKAGQTLQVAAQEAFNARLVAIGGASEAKKSRDAAWRAAREEFVEFRSTVQARYPDPETRKALGAAGALPMDLQKFVTQATAAYRAAQEEPFATALAKRSFNLARLQLALAGLKNLTDLDNAFAAASGTSGGKVDERDEAVDALHEWMREFRANAQLALKKHPEHRLTLGL